MSKIKVKVDGEEFDFELQKDGEVILEGALKAGADAPFSCKGGICTTCRAKLIEGTVTMENNFALTDDEVSEGYILACQSHPTSDSVTISFDD